MANKWKPRHHRYATNSDNNSTNSLQSAFDALIVDDALIRDDSTSGPRDEVDRRRHLTKPTCPGPSRISYSQDELLKEGLFFCGFTEKRQAKVKHQRNEDRFRGNYGVSLLATSRVVADLLDADVIKKFNLRYFFLTLFWLKSYPTYLQIEGPWNLSTETIAPKVKEYALAIQQLKAKKIKWFSDEEINDDIFILSVDGVHCRVQEVRKDPGSKWYSHKSHRAALSYETRCDPRWRIF